MRISKESITHLELGDSQILSLISASVDPLKSISVLVKNGSQLAYKVKTYSNSSKTHLIESKIIKIIPNAMENDEMKTVLPINNEVTLNLGSKSSYISMVNFNPVIDQSTLGLISNKISMNSTIQELIDSGEFTKRGVIIGKNETTDDLITELVNEIEILNNDKYLIPWDIIFNLGITGINSDYWNDYICSIGYDDSDSLVNQILTGHKSTSITETTPPTTKLETRPETAPETAPKLTNTPTEQKVTEKSYTKEVDELRDMVQIFQDRYLVYFQWFNELDAVWYKYRDVLINETSEEMLIKFMNLLQDGTLRRDKIDLKAMDLSNNEKWIGYLNRWNDKVKDFLQLHNDIARMRWDIFEKSLNIERDAIKNGFVTSGEEFWEIYLLNK